jgi:hypothetical protein
MTLIVSTFHTQDPLDRTAPRCKNESPSWMDSTGVTHPPAPCSRTFDHAKQGSDVHRAVLALSDEAPIIVIDIYWTD